MKRRLLFAAVDIGWRIEHYTEFLTEKFNGKLEIESFVKFKLPSEQKKTAYTYEFNFYKYPKIVQWTISLAFFVYALFRYDVFYFFSGETLLTYTLRPFELSIYRFFGKKVIMHFVGADIRNSAYLRWLNEHFAEKLQGKVIEGCPPKQTSAQRGLVQLAEKKAHLIFVSTPDLLEFFSDKSKIFYIPVFIHEKKFTEELRAAHPVNFKEKKIRILFAPSNPPIKGANYILSAVKKWMSDKPDVEFVNMLEEKWKKQSNPFPPYVLTHLDLLAYMQSVDIVIDQVLIGWYGLLAVESLYLNKITICYIAADLKQYLSSACPILAFEKDLSEALDKAYAMAKYDVSRNFQAFVKQYHAIENSLFFELVKSVVCK